MSNRYEEVKHMKNKPTPRPAEPRPIEANMILINRFMPLLR